jgi:hypothetical protein
MKSVARIRLLKTENHNACVTVNCKVRRSAIALYCLYKASINPIKLITPVGLLLHI